MKKYLVLFFSFIFLCFSSRVRASENIIVDMPSDEYSFYYTKIDEFKLEYSEIDDCYYFYFDGVKHEVNKELTMVDGIYTISEDKLNFLDNSFTLVKDNKYVSGDGLNLRIYNNSYFIYKNNYYYLNKLEINDNSFMIEGITFTIKDYHYLKLLPLVIELESNENGYGFTYKGVEYTLDSNFISLNNGIRISNNRFFLEDREFTCYYYRLIKGDSVYYVTGSDNNYYYLNNGGSISKFDAYFYGYALDDKPCLLGEYLSYIFRFDLYINDDKQYYFSQEVCYEYDGVNRCNQDIYDKTIIGKRTSSNSFFYDFLPFYKSNFKFTNLTYKLVFIDINEPSNKIEKSYSYLENNLKYDEAFDFSMSDSFIFNNNNYLLKNSNGYYMVSFISSYRNSNYKYYYKVCFKDETSCLDEVKLDYFNGYYWFTYTGYEDVIFKIYIKDGNNVIYQNSKIYKIDYALDKTNHSKYSYGGAYLLGKDKELIINMESSINITNMYYLVSDKAISGSISEINNPISNGESINLSSFLDKTGYLYLYIRFERDDGSKRSGDYLYYIDMDSPEVSINDNSNEGVNKYNDINIEIVARDSIKVSSTYYKVIKSELESVSKDSIDITYLNSFKISDYYDGDGRYLVCSYSLDIAGNESSVICKSYIIDTLGLTKQEVSVNKISEKIEKEISVNISILGKDDNYSFLCELIKENEVINSKDELTKTCLNNKDTSISGEYEGNYKLWIYASDEANNYSLLQLDNIYKFDNIAPRVIVNINGDNKSYGNSVRVSLDISDINELKEVKYSFYKDNNKKYFIYNNEDITYPYDYYGKYKLEVIACDIYDNCNIYSFKDEYLIDTGKISISLVNSDTINLIKNQKYIEYGARASKGENKITLDYNITSNVNVNKVGVYYVKYESGEGINKVSVTRKVIVSDNKIYLYPFIACFIILGASLSLRLFYKGKKVR